MKKAALVILHAAYWLLYVLLILFTTLSANSRSGMPHLSTAKILVIVFYPPSLFVALMPAVLSFYIFYSLLFPRFLQRRRFLTLALYGLLTAAISGLLAAGFIVLVSIPYRHYSWGSFFAMSAFIAFVALVHGIIGLVIKGFISWYKELQLKEQLIRKNHAVELELIRSQLNPHFLFNTINNIDVLIGTDPEKASGYLNKLSDIMRFMLYETKTAEIPLTKELTYITKYIELQKIRTSNPHYVTFEVVGDPGDWVIEPLLFIPFVENAFKHAENKKVEHAINIRFQIDPDKIVFDCENSMGSADRGDEAGGLGNDLIRKRLSLLYPDRHILEIETENKIYKAKLQLGQHANELHYSRR